jgi:hypothetical protein
MGFFLKCKNWIKFGNVLEEFTKFLGYQKFEKEKEKSYCI